MLSLPSPIRIWLSRDPVDLRKAYDGLAAIVSERFHRDAYSGDVFVFFNRRRNRVKLLTWDSNGFWLHCKRLEGGTFEAVDFVEGEGEVVRIDRSKLWMLLEGIDTKRSTFHQHFRPRGRLQGEQGRTPAGDHAAAPGVRRPSPRPPEG